LSYLIALAMTIVVLVILLARIAGKVFSLGSRAKKSGASEHQA
jgi:hypothetical protein